MNARRTLLAVGLTVVIFAGGVFAGRKGKEAAGPFRIVTLDNVNKSSTRASGTDYFKPPYATNALNQLHQEGYDALSITTEGTRVVVLLKARE